MILKMGSGYILTAGKWKGKFLSYVLKFDSNWLIEWAIPACDIQEDVAIIEAALAVRELGVDPGTVEFWAAVDAIVDESGRLGQNGSCIMSRSRSR